MQKKMMKFEIGGIFFVLIMYVILQNLYEWCGKNAVGIIFGAVNDSIWESAKTLLLSYAAWGMIELLSLRLPFRRYIVTKIITLYLLGISYVLVGFVLSLFAGADFTYGFAAAIVCAAFTFYASYRLLYSDFKLENLFYPCFFLFLLFVALYSSLTPYPPKLYIFMDRATGLYGIIPQNIDQGAIALDAMYNF